MAVYTRKRKSGPVYYVSFMVDGQQVHERSGTNKREAEQLYKQRLREVAEGRYNRAARTGNVTVATFAEQWLSERTNRDSRHDAQRIRDHVLPVLGRLRMSDLTTRDCEALIRALTPQMSAKSVRNVWGTTKTMLTDALRAEVIYRDPTRIKRGVLPKAKSAPREIYERQEVAALLTDDRVSAEGRVLCALAFYLGLRKGEACGLRWGDVDAEATPLWAITVERQYDGRPLKTDQPRRIPVHPHLAEVLAEWKRHGFELWQGYKPTQGAPILPTRDGSHMTERQAYNRFTASCRAVGIEPRTVHASRHTFITTARRGGAPPDRIEVLTHNAKGTMVDHYTHWEWAPLCDAVRCVEYVAPHDAVSEVAGNGSKTEPAWGFEDRAESESDRKQAESDLHAALGLTPKPPRKAAASAEHDAGHVEAALETAYRLGSGDHCAHVLTHELTTAADGGGHG